MSQPVTTITSTSTVTVPTTVGTVTATATKVVGFPVFTFVILIPIRLDGCLPQTSFRRVQNIGGGSFNAAGEACAAQCIGKCYENPEELSDRVSPQLLERPIAMTFTLHKSCLVACLIVTCRFSWGETVAMAVINT